jgi:hypothetical protein
MMTGSVIDEEVAQFELLCEIAVSTSKIIQQNKVLKAMKQNCCARMGYNETPRHMEHYNT